MPPIHFHGLRDFIISRKPSGAPWRCYRDLFDALQDSNTLAEPRLLYSPTQSQGIRIGYADDNLTLLLLDSVAWSSTTSYTLDLSPFNYGNAIWSTVKQALVGTITATYDSQISMLGIKSGSTLNIYTQAYTFSSGLSPTITATYRLFNCPMILDDAPYYLWNRDRAARTSVSIKPSCKAAVLFQEKYTLPPSQTQRSKLFRLSTPTKTDGFQRAVITSDDSVLDWTGLTLFCVSPEVMTPSNNEERLAHAFMSGINYLSGNTMPFSAGTAYKVYDYVIGAPSPYNYFRLYRCKTDHTSGPFINESNFDIVTDEAHAFVYDPSDYSSLDFIPDDSIDGSKIYGLIDRREQRVSGSITFNLTPIDSEISIFNRRYFLDSRPDMYSSAYNKKKEGSVYKI